MAQPDAGPAGGGGGGIHLPIIQVDSLVVMEGVLYGIDRRVGGVVAKYDPEQQHWIKLSMRYEPTAEDPSAPAP